MRRSVLLAAALFCSVLATLIGAGTASAQTPPPGYYAGTNTLGVPTSVWAGKYVHPGGGVSNNILGGIDAVPGHVYEGPSIVDGAPVVHVDYSVGTPLVGSLIHDEIVPDPVVPGRWNGTMYFVGAGVPINAGYFTLQR